MIKTKAISPAKKNSKKIVTAPKAKILTKTAQTITLSRQQIEESIRLKAYEFYLMRLGQNGNALNDWLSAERIILQTP